MKGQKAPRVIPLRSARDLAAAHRAAARLMTRRGLTGLWIVQALHDDGCQAVRSQDDTDCRPPCAPDFVLMDFAAHRSFMRFDQAMCYGKRGAR